MADDLIATTATENNLIKEHEEMKKEIERLKQVIIALSDRVTALE